MSGVTYTDIRTWRLYDRTAPESWVGKNFLQYISDARVCGNKAKGLIIFVLPQCMREGKEDVFVV